MLYDRVRWLVLLLLFFFFFLFFFFSSRRRHTRCYRDWSSDVCSSDLVPGPTLVLQKYASFMFSCSGPSPRIQWTVWIASWTAHSGSSPGAGLSKIGRASCRERV